MLRFCDLFISRNATTRNTSCLLSLSLEFSECGWPTRNGSNQATLINACKIFSITHPEPLYEHASILPFNWSMNVLNALFIIYSSFLWRMKWSFQLKLRVLDSTSSPNCVSKLAKPTNSFSINLVNHVFVCFFTNLRRSSSYSSPSGTDFFRTRSY